MSDTMSLLLRRIRGLLGVGLATGMTWALLGAAIVGVVAVLDPPTVDPGEGPLWAAWTLGRAGFIAGVLAAAVLALAERRRSVAGLSLVRAAIWGALGGAALPWIMAPMAMLPLLTLLGAGTTVTIVGLARRGERLAVQARGELHGPSLRSG